MNQEERILNAKKLAQKKRPSYAYIIHTLRFIADTQLNGQFGIKELNPKLFQTIFYNPDLISKLSHKQLADMILHETEWFIFNKTK